MIELKKEKTTPPPKVEVITEESQKENGEGEKKVLTPLISVRLQLFFELNC